MSRRQGIFWLLTIPCSTIAPHTDPFASLPDGLQWIRGQKEIGAGGLEHWQVCVALRSKASLSSVLKIFPKCHAELSRSDAAAEYVWKEETRVEGTQFEHGAKPFQRNKKTDWEAVWTAAQRGDVDQIPASVRVVSYRTIRAIGSDYDRPRSIVRTCNVFWGPTGTGKSRTAWEQAGLEAYSKDPRSKFWCGYQGELHVVIDEFRGGIDISHLLRWLDRYPVRVEIKGSSRPLQATAFWITSNLDPRIWYPEIDDQTTFALLRRLQIVHFNEPLTRDPPIPLV